LTVIFTLLFGTRCKILKIGQMKLALLSGKYKM